MVSVGKFWDHLVSFLGGVFATIYAVILEFAWDLLGTFGVISAVILGTFGGHFGVVLRSFWARLGVYLDSFEDSKV